mgnify:CR=1 FL=1
MQKLNLGTRVEMFSIYSNLSTFRDEASAERYLNNPADTAPDELLTEIYIPIE